MSCGLRDSRRSAATDPILDVARVKASAPDAESLRDKQSAQVRSANRLFVRSA